MDKSKSERTQERILEEAADIFINEGYAASRTVDIAKAADVSEATLFKYFKSKQGLLDAVVGVFIDHISTKVIIDPLDEIFERNKDQPPKVLFKHLFLNRLALAKDFKKYGIVALTESRFNMGIREKIQTHIFPEVLVFGEKIVNHYKEQGVFRQDLDPFVTIRTAMMGVVGMMLTGELLGIPPKNGSLEEELALVLDIILNGLMVEQAQDLVRGDLNE